MKTVTITFDMRIYRKPPYDVSLSFSQKALTKVMTVTVTYEIAGNPTE